MARWVAGRLARLLSALSVGRLGRSVCILHLRRRSSRPSAVGEADRDPEELQHEVVITRPFYLGVHEVTQGPYEKIMGKNPSFFGPKNGGTPDQPVEQVRWAEAVEFCKRLSNLAAEQKAG